MLEFIAKIGLFFCQPTTLFSVMIIGFLTVNEKIYGQALFLVLFTMIYNYFLKSLWQMPLPLPLEGWAFPSGHMHSAFVVWGWIACQYTIFSLRAIIFFILCLVGYGIVYHGYHYPIDILGAVGFGTLSLIIYNYLTKLDFFNNTPYRLGILFTLLGIIFMALLPQNQLKPHLWQALGGLIGFSGGWFVLQKSQLPSFSLIPKIVSVVLGVAGSLLLIYSIKYLGFSPKVLTFVQSFSIAFWISTTKILIFGLFSSRMLFLHKIKGQPT